MAWTPQLITMFSELKYGMTSSPVLNRFEPDKPTFLHTDWIPEGMGWILIQTATDKESHHASTVLKENGTYFFDLSPHGARFQPIAFVSWPCTDFERNYHSFVGETFCG